MRHCQVLGVEIAAGTMKEAVTEVCAHLDRIRGHYITFVNTHAIVMACESDKYCHVQNKAAIAFADGAPIAFCERKKGCLSAERVAGPDFMTEIFAISAQKGYRHYFYGSDAATLQKLKANLEKTYPDIAIAGTYAPPYEKKLRKDYQEDITRINEANPDFVWIGLGAPKQEFWMYRQSGKINAVMLGVGAGFDFHAGVVRRAPKWMQRCGLEWLYRLLQEPGRLGGRYLKTNLKFLGLIVREWFKG
jgi:N-acetylglucosaminyldiphosphoundecaprenol N-acetyl-beta-D-mannosaminyltransferase